MADHPNVTGGLFLTPVPGHGPLIFSVQYLVVPEITTDQARYCTHEGKTHVLNIWI